jgi:hypothetical protein
VSVTPEDDTALIKVASAHGYEGIRQLEAHGRVFNVPSGARRAARCADDSDAQCGYSWPVASVSANAAKLLSIPVQPSSESNALQIS